MKIALDTNRCSDLDKGLPEVVEAVSNADEVFLPFIVLAELHAGFRNGTKRADNERKLRRFLAEPGVGVLYPDEQTVNVFAGLLVQLIRQGTPIPSHDTWIAALCIQHGLTLYARDQHFNHLPQLNRL